MLHKKMFYILLMVIFISGCVSEESKLGQEYISRAEEISDKYGLDDARISLEDLSRPSSTTMYSFEIRSSKFSYLSDEQKHLYLYELNQIIVDSDFEISLAVISGKVYQLSSRFDRAFVGNNSPIFPYGTPTGIPDDRIVFNPPVEVELILTHGQPYVLAADTIDYLIDYERYSVRDNNDPELRKIYDQGYAYYLNGDTNVLLLEIDGDFARVQLIEPHWDKKVGDVGWLRKGNIKSYPKP